MRPPGSTVSAIVAFLLVVGVMAGCAPVGAAEPRAAGPPPGEEHVALGPLAGRTGAFLTLADAAGRVQVTAGVLPGLLYRISTPADSGLKPRVTGQNGRLTAELLETGDDGPDAVRIVLNRDVRWDIRLPAGAGEQQLDLRHGRITGLALGPSGLIELRLPAPAGTVPVDLVSGAGNVVLTAAQGTPLRIQLDRGAGSASAPWTVPGPAPAGTVLQTASWPAAASRYTIRAHAGVGSLTVS